jgi:hypothetical protein
MTGNAAIKIHGEGLRMKRHVFLTISMLFVGDLSSADDHAPTTQLSISMFLENYGGAFVTRHFAERMAQIVIEEKYPSNVIQFAGVADVVDKEGAWWVKVNIRVPPASPIASLARKDLTQMTIQIRKTNAEIVSIS